MHLHDIQICEYICWAQRLKAFTQQKNQRVLAKNHNTNCAFDFLNMLECVVSVFQRAMTRIVVEYQKNVL